MSRIRAVGLSTAISAVMVAVLNGFKVISREEILIFFVSFLFSSIASMLLVQMPKADKKEWNFSKK